MIHEALLFLWNCEGGVFNKDTGEDWLNMIELKDFLHPGERKLLQRIMYIALDHHEIEEFIKMILTQSTNKFDTQTIQEVFQGNDNNATDDERSSVHSSGNSIKIVATTTHGSELELKMDEIDFVKMGLYMKAFCYGLDSVLEDYRNDIVEIEKTVLQNPLLPLTYVLSCVDKYKTLFDAIKSMIRVIKIERVYGCVLVGRLYKYCNCGIKLVSDAATRIIQSVNTVFYRHLCNWIIFGDLVDVYQEFFIVDAKCADEDFLWDNMPHDGQNSLECFNEALKRYRIKQPPKVRKFYIKSNMLPSNMRMEIAQTILFMGRMVWIIRNDPTSVQDDGFQLKLKRDIWDGKEMYYFQKLQDLENSAFNLVQFEKTIEDCRLCLTQYLWKVMVEEAKLFDHLQLLRDYYALGRGELFQHFIISVEENIKEAPSDYLILKLNTVFNETAKKIYFDSDNSYKRFELVFSNKQENIKVIDPWQQINMNFEIMWPLHIIFHPGAMRIYNDLFKFLLRVKKTQIDLQRLWMTHMEGKVKIHNGVCALRHSLTFLVNNLQYYLQVDVIEAQFAVLRKSVNNAKNVEDIIRFHSDFLGNLMSRTFIVNVHDEDHSQQKRHLYKLPSLNYDDKNIVHKMLLSFLKLCDQFCTKASTWGTQLNDIEERELSELQSNCDSIVEHLLEMLYALRDHTSGNHLRQLLYRIDFNRWFSKNKPDFNTSVV